jgi:23S rRNA (pseudouridine1915-N3)-methyltransferase
MKIWFWSIGKSNESYVKEGIADFTKRISRYFPVEWTIIPVPKNSGMLSEMDLKKKEGETILQWLRQDDYLIALDEHGNNFPRKDCLNYYRKEPVPVQKILFSLLAAHLD